VWGGGEGGLPGLCKLVMEKGHRGQQKIRHVAPNLKEHETHSNYINRFGVFIKQYY
jgi:hypothetical protein